MCHNTQREKCASSKNPNSVRGLIRSVKIHYVSQVKQAANQSFVVDILR